MIKELENGVHCITWHKHESEGIEFGRIQKLNKWTEAAGEGLHHSVQSGCLSMQPFLFLL